MAKTNATKTVTKNVKTAAAPAKKAVANRAKTVRATAPKADAKSIFANPLEAVRRMTGATGEKATAFAKDAVAFNKANLEALTEAGKLAAKGAQTAVQNSVEQGRKNWEATSAHAKALTGVRAPTDFFQLQSEFVRKQFDVMVSGISKSTEFNLKLAGDVAAPIRSRYVEVAEQFKSRLAA